MEVAVKYFTGGIQWRIEEKLIDFVVEEGGDDGKSFVV